MNRHIAILLFPFMLSACNNLDTYTKQELYQDSVAQIVADTIVNTETTDNTDTLIISSASQIIYEAESDGFYVDSYSQKYSKERYQAIFDSLANSLVPNDSMLLNDKYKKEYSKDKKITITYLPNISPLMKVRVIDCQNYLCYEFNSKVEDYIVLGYLLYSKETPYKLIKKNEWLLSGNIVLAVSPVYSEDDRGLLLSYNWYCSCCTETVTKEGTYDLKRGVLLYSSRTDATEAEPEEDGTYSYNNEQTIEEYYRISDDTIKFQYSKIIYKLGNDGEIESGNDSIHFHILTPEDIKNRKDKEVMDIPNLGQCC